MKKYGNDYRSGEKGYEYTGSWYETVLGIEELKKQVMLFTAELTLLSVLFVLGINLRNEGSYVFWILIPYVCMFLPIAYGWMGSYGLFCIYRKKSEEAGVMRKMASKCEKSAAAWEPEKGNRKSENGMSVTNRAQEHREHMTRAEYDRGIRRPFRCGLGNTVLSGLTLLADLIFVIWPEKGFQNRDEILFFAEVAVIFAVSSVFAAHSCKVMRSTRKLN